jgi:hypothetical protein
MRKTNGSPYQAASDFHVRERLKVVGLRTRYGRRKVASG